ncbi:hypothetical protein NDU88_003896 [Pleurodeles waltl]|uniref:Uncharacterized protein n=1 Tax=Pleurodeles waltl TaxID=8319 RepID=A0AAV7TPQ3_PLEWA|nr:hypothetical protein NDU88_003896 [Pleurodeles waltl]
MREAIITPPGALGTREAIITPHGKKRGLTVGARKVSVPTRGGGARTHPPPLVPAVRSRHLPHFSGKKKAVRPRGNTQEQLILAQEKRQRWNRPRSESEGTEENNGQSFAEEGELLGNPFQASEELKERDNHSLKVCEGSEERVTAEVPSAIIRREGMGRYNLRPHISVPGKLKDYVLS